MHPLASTRTAAHPGRFATAAPSTTSAPRGTKTLLSAWLCIACSFAVGRADGQQSGLSSGSYADGHGGQVELPLGDLSFGDRVVSFELGSPAPVETERDPEQALGPPDYRSPGDGKAVSLGCGGVLVLAFEDNALVDRPGADLYVFEVGKQVEATRLEISQDGERWIDVGRIAGSRADVDIGAHAEPGSSFRYLRLSDGRSNCKGRWPGADIDAVAAIGSAERIVLDGEVLFDFDRYELRADARTSLDVVRTKISQVRPARVLIEGHTDSLGDDEYNLSLSLRRAEAVRSYLQSSALPDELILDVSGAGETQPIATNGTDEGRARNRRVEIILVPGPR